MSIVTLRSTEGPGNDSTKPVNWTNNFKDPIYFNKDDKIQITSVTCNQKVSNFEVDGSGQGGTFTHMEGPSTGATTDDPFFFRKIAQVPPGSYSPAAMAAAMQGTLNESNLLQVYDFTVDYDDITDPNNPEFDISYIQKAAPASDNTGTQGERVDGTGTAGGQVPTYGQVPANAAGDFATFPLCQAAPGATNSYALHVATLNSSLAPNTPTAVEQAAKLLSVNYNPLLIGGPTSSLITAPQLKYVMPKGIFGNGGKHEMRIQPTFILHNVDLKEQGTGTDEYVRIENYFGAGAHEDFKVLVPAGQSQGQALTWDYELESATGFIDEPTAMSVMSIAGYAGLNNSSNNALIGGGGSYVAGRVYNTSNQTHTNNPVIIATTVSGTGAITSYEVIHPGAEVQISDVIVVQGGNNGAQIFVQAGGLRTHLPGKNNSAGTALTVGNEYIVAFVKGSLANPSVPGAAVTETDILNDANAINLRMKVTAIDATSRLVTGLQYVSCGLRPGDADFTRLKTILTHGDTFLTLVDNNNSLSSVSTSIVEITARATSVSKIKFVSRPDGLCGIGPGDSTNDPTDPNAVLLGYFTNTFSSFQDTVIPPGTITRALMPQTGNLYEINKTTGATVASGMKIRRLNFTTGAVTDTLNFRTGKAKPECKVGLMRNELRRRLEQNTGVVQDNMNLCDIEVAFTQQFGKVTNTSSATTIAFQHQSYTATISVVEYPTGDTINFPADGVRKTQYTQNLLAGLGYSANVNDKVEFTLDKLNQLTISISQPDATAFTKQTVVLGSGSGINPIKESMFPLCPSFQCAIGVPGQDNLPSTQQIGGLDIIDIQGKYATQEVNVDLNHIAGVYGNAYDHLFVGNSNRFCPPTAQPTLTAQTSDAALIKELTIVYTFNKVTSASIDFTNANPTAADKIGFTQYLPDISDIGPFIGFDAVLNESTKNDQKTVVSSSKNDLVFGIPPTVIVEFPDFNINGYSGAAADKFKIVAVIPTEEWATNQVNGTIHYKPLFPLPIDVNLPEDRELYTISCRIRNLDGTLASNLSNPTTVTFYKGPREGKELEGMLNRVLQARSEKQDQKISMTGGNEPFY